MNYNFPKYSDYVESLVAFIDILGFDSRARNIKSEADFNKVGKLLFTLKEAEKRYTAEKNLFQNLNVTAISDSVILTMPWHDHVGTLGLIFILQKIQYDLLATNFETLIRGYVASGHVYHKENIIFGAAYSGAYRREREIGCAPRIVVDPIIVEDAKKSVLQCKNLEKMDHISNYIIEDSSDGRYFVDYLNPIGLRVGVSKEQYKSERAAINKFIEANLIKYKDNENIASKYKWLQAYHARSDHYLA